MRSRFYIVSLIIVIIIEISLVVFHYYQIHNESITCSEVTSITSINLPLGTKIELNMLSDDIKNNFIIDDSKVDYDNCGSYEVNLKLNNDDCNCEYNIFLNILPVYEEINHELKTEFNINELIASEELYNNVENYNIDNLDINNIGDYKVSVNINGKEYYSIIHVNDTQAPMLEVRNIIYYINDEKEIDKTDFIVSVSDISNYSISYEGEIDLNTLGEHVIKVTATDEYNNAITKESFLIVKNDDIGPVISKLNTLTITRGDTSIDYLKDVKSVDESDGECEVKYDLSGVNFDKYGTYYITYSSTDKSLNTTTKERTLIIEHNQEDTEELFMEFYNKYLKDKSVLEMTTIIRNKVRYKNVRGKDAIWTAMTTMSGSCYVHAALLHKALDTAGIENMLIYNNSQTHFWVIVKENDVWRHYDPTPGNHKIGPLTDSQMSYQSSLGHLVWDNTIFPSAK